eukprot:9993949-Alexandrium_andersonii.AAC.1
MVGDDVAAHGVVGVRRVELHLQVLTDLRGAVLDQHRRPYAIGDPLGTLRLVLVDERLPLLQPPHEAIALEGEAKDRLELRQVASGDLWE